MQYGRLRPNTGNFSQILRTLVDNPKSDSERKLSLELSFFVANVSQKHVLSIEKSKLNNMGFGWTDVAFSPVWPIQNEHFFSSRTLVETSKVFSYYLQTAKTGK